MYERQKKNFLRKEDSQINKGYFQSVKYIFPLVKKFSAILALQFLFQTWMTFRPLRTRRQTNGLLCLNHVRIYKKKVWKHLFL